MEVVRTYRERKHRSFYDRVRRGAREAAIFTLALGRSVPNTSNWIRFPYYHHIFDDERVGFEAHLRYFRKFGDFLSLDDAAGYLQADKPPVGRYFCLTFDDGLKNSLTNAAPILADAGAVAAFFVPTGFIGLSPQRDDDEVRRFFKRLISPPVEMMTWEECGQLAKAGMTIGSHGMSHTRLLELSRGEVEREMRESKSAIETALGAECRHFSPPFGMPVLDFDPSSDPQLARTVGYRTFLTSRRGSAGRRSPLLGIERDMMVAAWPTYQLRYFLSR